MCGRDGIELEKINEMGRKTRCFVQQSVGLITAGRTRGRKQGEVVWRCYSRQQGELGLENREKWCGAVTRDSREN